MWTSLNGSRRYCPPSHTTYGACPESIQPFWISQPVCGLDVTWQPVRGDLAVHPWTLFRGASQSAVRRRWLSLCTVGPSHSHWPREQISESASMRLPILHLSCRLSLAKHHITEVFQHPYSPNLDPLDFWFSPKLKSPLKFEEICECDRPAVHKLSQRRLTADWLAPRESDCSRMHSKVSSDWLPNYIKATRPVLQIFKMAGYFPDSPHIHVLPLCICFFANYTEALCKILQINAGTQVTSGTNLNTLRFIFVCLI
jgi:hypothetical protein